MASLYHNMCHLVTYEYTSEINSLNMFKLDGYTFPIIMNIINSKPDLSAAFICHLN
jgi:hypothetical protein